MGDADSLPPDVDDLSDTDFKCTGSSAKKPRAGTPVSKDSTPKPSHTPAVSAVKTGKSGTASGAQVDEEVIKSKTGKGYLKVSGDIVVGCHGNFRKNFNIDKFGGKQKAIDAGHEWLASRQQQPDEKKVQSHKEATKTDKDEMPVDKKRKAKEKPDTEKAAQQKEAHAAIIDKFTGPAKTPKADDTWNTFVAWRVKELREGYPGQVQAVYFGICAKEWRTRAK
jgi:hypothetical protein